MKEIISQNLMELRGRIADACDEHDRDADDITLVAVSKTHPVESVRRVVAAGVLDVGESRVQEAVPKIEELGPIARFHLIGHLQTNKVKAAVSHFDVIQSVDSLRVAEEINRRADEHGRSIECYVEVNTTAEPQKYGVRPDETVELVSKVNRLAALRLTGLMTIGPLTDDEEAIRGAFRICRGLFREARDLVGPRFDTLSMGMSDDFRLAIAEGSTMIRVGTALFGPRQS